jgi:hypothetical protein
MSAVPAWAVRGRKVVFKPKPEGRPRHSLGNYPVPDGVYTIRKVVICQDGKPAILLDEINNEHLIGTFGDREPGFGTWHFRPAIEPKSEAHDLAMFRDLIRQPERA